MYKYLTADASSCTSGRYSRDADTRFELVWLNYIARWLYSNSGAGGDWCGVTKRAKLGGGFGACSPKEFLDFSLLNFAHAL